MRNRGFLREYGREIITVVCLLVCLGLLAFLRVQSGSTETTLETQAQANLLQMSELESSLRKMKSMTPQQALLLSELLPTSIDVPSVLQEASDVAGKAHVSIDAFQFSPTPVNDGSAAASASNTGNLPIPGVQSYRAIVTASGSMSALLAFIDGLQRYPRLTAVQTISWSNLGTKPSAAIVYSVFADTTR